MKKTKVKVHSYKIVNVNSLQKRGVDLRAVDKIIDKADELFPEWKYIYSNPSTGDLTATTKKCKFLIPSETTFNSYKLVPKNKDEYQILFHMDPISLQWKRGELLVIKKKKQTFSGNLVPKKKLKKMLVDLNTGSWKYIYINPANLEFVGANERFVYQGNELVPEKYNSDARVVGLGIYATLEIKKEES